MSVLSFRFKYESIVQTRSNPTKPYMQKKAHQVKVDQTVRLRASDRDYYQVFSVLDKVIDGKHVILTVRTIANMRSQFSLLSAVHSARLSKEEFLEFGLSRSNITLEREELGIKEVDVHLTRCKIREEVVCSCCGQPITRTETGIRAHITPSDPDEKFVITPSRTQRDLYRHFHFHNCMDSNQEYKVLVDLGGLQHISIEVMDDWNQKAANKAREFQAHWVLMSEDKSFYLFAHDTTSIIGAITMMKNTGNPAKFICRTARSSLNFDHPISIDQLTYLLNIEGYDLNDYISDDHEYVIGGEHVDTNEPYLELAKDVHEARAKCIELRKSDKYNCFGFVRQVDVKNLRKGHLKTIAA